MPSFFLAIALLIATLSAHAGDIPDNVRREVERSRDLCLSNGGTTGPIEAALFEYDVDGDGLKDWIVDPRKLNCQGSRTVMCDDECSFHLYIGRPDGTFHGWVHITVVNWEVGRTLAGKPALFLTRATTTALRDASGARTRSSSSAAR